MSVRGYVLRLEFARSSSIAPLSVVAGSLLVVYALTKDRSTTAIVEGGWQFAGLTPVQTALLVHVVEAVPLLCLALGLVSLHVRAGSRGGLAAAGITVSIAGFVLTVLSHVCEHLLPPVTVPALTGGENLLIWGYYLSWLVLYVGFATYGFALAFDADVPGWLPRLFVLLLPSVVLAGLVVVVFDLFTLAGTFRVGLGVTWIAVGWWLSSVRLDDPDTRPFSPGGPSH